MKHKIVTLNQFITLKKSLSNTDKIVFTNGCFDVIHFGHIDYLQKAKALGDYLVVGLNSDASIKRLKGEKRPINPEWARAGVLNAIEAIDYIIIFEEDTPMLLIQNILPNILVKGGDYTIDNIVGAELVIQHGGEVKTIPFVEGFSSSSIINKLMQ